MTKAIILTTQRSGSTFLVECLESHPEVFCLGEMLAGGHVWVPNWVYRWRYAKKAYRYLRSGAFLPIRMMNRHFARTNRPVLCFKAMYNHICPPWTVGYLREHTEIRILHLRRHNLLKQYVSHVLLSVKRDKVWDPIQSRRWRQRTLPCQPRRRSPTFVASGRNMTGTNRCSRSTRDTCFATRR